MQPALAVLCGTALIAVAAAADTVALLQESLRVRDQDQVPASNEWWIFSRHRHSKEQGQVEGGGLLPGHIVETNMDSFGTAENPSVVSEEGNEEDEETEEVWLARKPSKKKATKESGDSKKQDGKKEATKESGDSKKQDGKKEATKESADSKGQSGKKEAAETKPKVAPEKVEAKVAEAKPAVAQKQEEAKDQSFQIGEQVQMQDSTSESGHWFPAKIARRGHWPATWVVTCEGREFPDIPGQFLRRPPTPAARPKAPQPSASRVQQPQANATAAMPRPNAPAEPLPFGPYNPYRYRVNDTMEVKTESGRWVPCKITKKGKDDDKYDLYIPMAPPGHREVKNIHSAALRPMDAAEYAKVDKLMSNPSVDYGKLLGDMVTAEKDYAVGEQAEVRIGSGKYKGGYIACEVLGEVENSEPKTFRIRVGEQEHNVPYQVLRKAASHKQSKETAVSEQPQVAAIEEIKAQAAAAEQKVPSPEKEAAAVEDIKAQAAEAAVEQKAPTPAKEARLVEAPSASLPHFVPGDAAEVLVKDGPNKGTWIKVSISSLGANPNTYNIDTGSATFNDVPASTLRVVDQSTAWDI